MRYYTYGKESKFSIEFEKLVLMSPKERKEYFEALMKKILDSSNDNEKVKVNLEDKVYELNGQDVSIFMQCYDEYKKALEDFRQLELHTPTCRIDWIKIKDFTLEEKLNYFLDLIEDIEAAPIVKAYTFMEGGVTHVINEKDRSTYKVCKKEIKKCISKIANRDNVVRFKALCKDYKNSLIDSTYFCKNLLNEKIEESLKKKKKNKKKGRVFGGRVKISTLKKGAALACSLGFIGNIALETISEGVKVNREALQNLPLEAAIEVEKEEETKEESPVEMVYDIVDVDEVEVEALREACALDETDLENEISKVQEEKEVKSILVYYNGLTNTFSLEEASIKDNLENSVSQDENDEAQDKVKKEVVEESKEDRRALLIDSYLEEYSLYFNMDKDKVISLARDLTDDYKEDFASIIGSDEIDLSDDEVAAMVFVYQLRRDKLAITLNDLGTSKQELIVSTDVYMQGRCEGDTLVLRTGETENQFLVRICQMLGTDEMYSLAISLSETRQFQSPMCRDKNNYGGLRSTKEYMTFPSPEAGIIAFCMNLKKYEKYNLQSLEALSSIYVRGSRKAEPSPVWMKNVKSFHSQIDENYEEFTGYPDNRSDKTISLY